MKEEIELAKIYDRDPDTFESIMQEYGHLLWVIAGGILKQSGAAEDIEECVSDAFIRLWQNPQGFQPARGNLKTYLAVMVRSLALDRYRKISKHKEQELEDTVGEGGDPFEQVVDAMERKMLHKAVFALKEPDREIMVRRYYYEQKPAEIAAQSGMPVKEIRNRLYQGKERIKKMLQGKGRDL